MQRIKLNLFKCIPTLSLLATNFLVKVGRQRLEKSKIRAVEENEALFLTSFFQLTVAGVLIKVRKETVPQKNFTTKKATRTFIRQGLRICIVCLIGGPRRGTPQGTFED